MTKRVLSSVGSFTQHYPKIALVVTSHSQGKENALAIAWHSSVSLNPPLYGIAISPRRFSYKLILESGEFGLNFLPLEKAGLVAAVGGTRGSEVDKFQQFHIEMVKGVKTSVPILQDAYIAYECRLIDHKTYGDHAWMVGEVVALHLQPDILTEKQVLDLGRISPTLYLGGDAYTTTIKESRHLPRGRLG